MVFEIGVHLQLPEDYNLVLSRPDILCSHVLLFSSHNPTSAVSKADSNISANAAQAMYRIVIVPFLAGTLPQFGPSIQQFLTIDKPMAF